MGVTREYLESIGWIFERNEYEQLSDGKYRTIEEFNYINELVSVDEYFD